MHTTFLESLRKHSNPGQNPDQAQRLRGMFTPDFARKPTPEPLRVQVTAVQPLSSGRQLGQAMELMEALTPNVTLEKIQQAITLRDWLKEKLAEIDELCKARTLEWIQENKQDVTIGPKRYYAGMASSVKCVNIPKAIEAILEKAQGDIAQVCGCLASDAIKHGAAAKLLDPDIYGALFKTERKAVLKDGKPQQQLLQTNDEFVARAKALPAPDQTPGSTPAKPEPASDNDQQ